jgi:hypothetical protein
MFMKLCIIRNLGQQRSICPTPKSDFSGTAKYDRNDTIALTILISGTFQRWHAGWTLCRYFWTLMRPPPFPEVLLEVRRGSRSGTTICPTCLHGQFTSYSFLGATLIRQRDVLSANIFSMRWGGGKGSKCKLGEWMGWGNSLGGTWVEYWATETFKTCVLVIVETVYFTH